MAVLVEAISVIVRRDAIEDALGGWDAFVQLVPNKTLCADSEIARVGFMTPQDVETFIRSLETLGIRYLVDGKAQGIAVVDQMRGPTIACDWLEFGHASIGANNDQCVAACRLTGSKVMQIVTPDGWTFEGSLSSSFSFVPTEHITKAMKFLRHEDGLDAFWDELAGKEVFVGRTSQAAKESGGSG